MILRTITRHVRDQNWLAVGIDFLIVVVGVFIGIQVANWNGERADRVESGNVLERLEQEFQMHLERTDRSLAMHEPQCCISFRAGTAALPGTAAFPASVLALPILT